MKAPDEKRCGFCAEERQGKETVSTKAVEYVARKLVTAFPSIELEAVAELFEDDLSESVAMGRKEAVLRVGIGKQLGARGETQEPHQKNQKKNGS